MIHAMPYILFQSISMKYHHYVKVLPERSAIWSIHIQQPWTIGVMTEIIISIQRGETTANK